jgi:hemolysin III
VTLDQPDWLVAARRRPRFRGVLHQYAFFASLVVGVLLVVGADGGTARLSALVFAASVAAMLGISALYHRVIWPPAPRRWIRRLDHAAIFLLIAGTYTPFGLVALDGGWRISVLAIAWSGALAAIVLKVAWIDAPRWVAALVAVCLGWVGVVALPEVHGSVGLTPLMLLAAGGLLYSCGAIIYALRRPDPAPSIFGYHELFHALVVAAAACQYVAVALFVL